MGVARQEAVVIEEADGTVFDLQQDLLANGRVGELIPVGVKADQAVLVDLAEDLQRGIIFRSGKLAETGLFLLPALGDRLPVSSMHAGVGHRVEPGKQIPVRLIDRAEPVATPEALADVVHGTFHLALHPGAVRRAGLGRKAAVVGEVQQLDIEVHLAAVAPDHHMLHVVVEHLGGHAAQVMKRTFVAIQKALQGAALDELDIHRPAVAQQHQEEVDGAGAATGFGDFKVSPVHLSLQPRHGLETAVGDPGLLFFEGTHKALDCVVATGIADLLEPIKDPAGPVVVLADPVLDDPHEGGQDGDSAFGAAVLGEALAQDVLLDRVAVKPQTLGDETHAVTLTVQCNNVHKNLLCDHSHLLGCPRRLPCHPWEGGTLFIPVSGTFLHSRRHHSKYVRNPAIGARLIHIQKIFYPV